MVFNTTAGFILMTNGSWIQAVLGSYTDIMGNWFYFALYGLAFFMIYMKTQNFVGTAMLGLVTLSAIIPVLMPEAFGLIYILIGLAITITLYKVFHK